MKYVLVFALALFAVTGDASARADQQLTPDEAAMVVGTLVVATSECGVRATDQNLNVAVARHGQDLVDFQPGNRYAPLVQVKMKKAYEFIRMYGKDTACNGMIGTVNQFLPGSIR